MKLGTIHEQNSDIVYDVMPIMDSSKPRSRLLNTYVNEPNYDSTANRHGVFKRRENITRFDNVVDDYARLKIDESRQQSG